MKRFFGHAGTGSKDVEIRPFARFICLHVLFLFFLFLSAASLFAAPAAHSADKVVSPGGYEALIAGIDSHGSARLIVGVDVPFRPMASPESAESVLQMQAISSAQDRLLAGLSGMSYKGVHKYRYIPYMVLEADRAVLNALLDSHIVTSVHEDTAVPPTLDLSVPRIGAPQVWSAGYTGSGVTLTVLDTGVDKTHPFLSGAVVSEACYSSTVSGDGATSACPGGATGGLTSTGSAMPYAGNCPAGACDHGTHVAGIAAGRQSAAGSPGPGVAPNASVIAVQVFSRFDNLPGCTPGSTCACGTSPCVMAYDSDVLRGLERIYALRSTRNISSINLSLGGGKYSSQSACDTDMSSTKAAIDNLRAAGIATIISSGNSGYCGYMGKPGCISSAISVGATTDADGVASYSNSASFLSLLAPGSDIISSIPGGSYARYWGTSMAAPHVTGAWALMKQAQSSATVDDILYYFQNMGQQVTDAKCPSVSKRRINVNEALNRLRNAPYVKATGTTGIGQSSAVIHGIARANTSTPASISVQYGTTTSYGSTIATTPLSVTGALDTSVSATMSGLSPNTLYHYRLIGIGTYGTSYSEDMSFITPGSCGTIQSGDLEGYPPLAGWTEASTHCGTPLCNAYDNQDCIPHSGAGAAMFGCFVRPEIGSLTQDITIPRGASQNLQFYLYNTAASGNGTDSYSVLIDGLPILSVFESDPLYFSGYTMASLDLSPYADGNTHTLSLYGAMSGATYFLVDDISMSCSKGTMPYAETGDVIPVDAYEINLTGTINAFGLRTTASFDYGTTDAYGHSVSADPAAIGINGDYPVTVNLPTVSPGTVYHYRVRGQSSSGIAYGRDMSFMTYCSSAEVRIGAMPFASIQSAVGSAVNGSAILVNNAAFTENITVGGSGSIRLKGGYDCSFGSTPGFSTLKGSITFEGSRGVTVDNFIVQ